MKDKKCREQVGIRKGWYHMSDSEWIYPDPTLNEKMDALLNHMGLKIIRKKTSSIVVEKVKKC